MRDDAGLRRPKLLAPPGACDAHVHVFEPARLAALVDPKAPSPAPLADYLMERSRLGLSRSIVVQPTAFRFDNAGTLDALAALGDTARGVVMLGPTVGAAEMRRLSELGVCGSRFHLLRSGLLGWDDLSAMAPRIADAGWHCQVQLDGGQLPERAATLAALPGTLVIDHIGKFLDPVTVDDPAFGALLRLMDRGNTYVKLCGPYEVSRTGPPAYADVGVLAEALARAAPERMLWGSNWPHQSTPVDRRPDEADLLDLMTEWIPDAARRRLALVDNAERLYGFTPVPTGTMAVPP